MVFEKNRSAEGGGEGKGPIKRDGDKFSIGAARADGLR